MAYVEVQLVLVRMNLFLVTPTWFACASDFVMLLVIWPEVVRLVNQLGKPRTIII